MQLHDRVEFSMAGHWTRRPLALLAMAVALIMGLGSAQTAMAAAPIRVVQIDLDYAYDPDPAQQASNVELLIKRVIALQVNTVFLEAFADPDSTGVAHQVYFPNRVLPVRTDLFASVVKQLQARAKVKVFAWMPVIAFDFGKSVSQILALNPKTGLSAPDPTAYARVSPFDPVAVQKILMVYEDLAKAAPIDGLLFSDDAQMSDSEDNSQGALAAYQRLGLGSLLKKIRSSSTLMQQWTTLKTETLITLTQNIAATVSKYRWPLLTARNIYAQPVINPVSEQWFAQKFSRFLTAYDYTAIETMPYMENVPASQSQAWIKNMVNVVAAQSLGLQHTIFELQSVDWNKNSAPISSTILDQQMKLLQSMNAPNYGYYPDNFYGDQPKAAIISKDMVVSP